MSYYHLFGNVLTEKGLLRREAAHAAHLSEEKIGYGPHAISRNSSVAWQRHSASIILAIT